MRYNGVSPALARPSKTVTPAHEAPLPASRNSSSSAPADDFNAQLAQAQQNAAPAAKPAARTPAPSGAEPAAARTTPTTAARAAPSAANSSGTARAAGRVANRDAGGARAAAASQGADVDASAIAGDAESATGAPTGAARPARRIAAPLTGAPDSPAATSDGAAPISLSTAIATPAEPKVGLPPAAVNVASSAEGSTQAPAGASSADADDADPADPNGSNAAQLLLMLPMLTPVPVQSRAAASTGAPSTGVAGTAALGTDTSSGTSAPTLDGALLAGLAHTLAGLDAPSVAGDAGRRLADATGTGGGAADPTPATTQAVGAGDGGATPPAALDPTLASNPTAAATTPAPVHVHATVGSAQWPEEVASHLLLMSTHGIQSAELRLTPADLGPVQVRIDVQDGAASVWFQAAHPDTRTALENALPHLKHMLAGQGLTLTDAGVHREPPRDAPAPRAAAATVQAVAPVGAASPAGPVRIGLIDAYA